MGEISPQYLRAALNCANFFTKYESLREYQLHLWYFANLPGEMPPVPPAGGVSITAERHARKYPHLRDGLDGIIAKCRKRMEELKAAGLNPGPRLQALYDDAVDARDNGLQVKHEVNLSHETSRPGEFYDEPGVPTSSTA